MFVDRLVNLVSGLGTGRDKSTASAFVHTPLTPHELEAAYRNDWIARKIIDIPADDETREGRTWQAEDADVTALENRERQLGLWRKVCWARKLARLYGGSALYVGVRGAVDPNDELFPDRVGRGAVEFLHVLGRHDLTTGDVNRDPLSPYFGQPEYYEVTTGVGADRRQIRIHPSRIVPFVGAPLPNPLNEAWGDSILQATYDAVQNASSSQQQIASWLHEAKIDVISMPGLSDALSTPEGSNRLTNRFALANMLKSSQNMLLLESDGVTGEQWDQKQLSFATIPDILRGFLQVAAGAADIPVTRLLGQSPAGLNSTGESDIRNYYDHIAAKQETELRPALERLDEILVRDAIGRRPADLWYEFDPLWQLSAQEQADNATKKANAVKVYVETGLFPMEALAEGVKNMLIEDALFPGFEQAIEEAPEIDFEAQAEAETAAVVAAATPEPRAIPAAEAREE